MQRLDSTLPFLEVIEGLKHLERTSWGEHGVRDPESVSSRMYQMAFVAMMHPDLEGDDQTKAILLCLIFDTSKAVAGDTIPFGPAERETKALKERLGIKYLSCLLKKSNPVWADRLMEIWHEYHTGSSRVINIVHDIERFECLHQALMYQKRDFDATCLTELRSLRDEITDPWLKTQADSIIEEWDAKQKIHKATIIFMIGGPGVGKGTQCAKLVEDFNLEHISVGDLLRNEKDDPDSVFGEFLQESMQNSVIVPPSLTTMLLKDKIQEIQSRGNNVLIDGFPRSIEQAKAFEAEITNHYTTIFLNCSPEAMVERVMKRSESSNRDDDNMTTLKKRLKTFQDSNQGVKNYLSYRDVFEVDCAGTPDSIYTHVRELVRGGISK